MTSMLPPDVLPAEMAAAHLDESPFFFPSLIRRGRSKHKHFKNDVQECPFHSPAMDKGLDLSLFLPPTFLPCSKHCHSYTHTPLLSCASDASVQIYLEITTLNVYSHLQGQYYYFEYGKQLLAFCQLPPIALQPGFN